MTQSFKVFNIPMERRSTRRKLVLFTYLGLAAVCALCVVYSRTVGFWYGIYAGLFVVLYVFGGQGRYGLLKSFTNKPPRPEPIVVDAIRLNLQPESLLRSNNEDWKNDERELSRRDLAHYRAYAPVSLGLLALLLLSALALHPWPWISPAIILLAIFATALFTTVAALTLPSAIILWTEPDMDTQ